MDQRRNKLIVYSVLNFRRVTHFCCACLKRKWKVLQDAANSSYNMINHDDDDSNNDVDDDNDCNKPASQAAGADLFR